MIIITDGQKYNFVFIIIVFFPIQWDYYLLHQHNSILTCKSQMLCWSTLGPQELRRIPDCNVSSSLFSCCELQQRWYSSCLRAFVQFLFSKFWRVPRGDLSWVNIQIWYYILVLPWNCILSFNKGRNSLNSQRKQGYLPFKIIH